MFGSPSILTVIDGRSMTLYHGYFITQLIDQRMDQSSSSVCIWKWTLTILYLTLVKTWFFSFWKVYFMHMWPLEIMLFTMCRQTYYQRTNPCCLMNLFRERLHLWVYLEKDCISWAFEKCPYELLCWPIDSFSKL